MSRWQRIQHCCKKAQAMWVFLLCMGLLVCSLTQVARVANSSIRSSIRNMARNQHKSTLVVGRWQFASAHSNVALLAETRQERFTMEQGAALLVARSASSKLGLVLPLLALFAGLAVARSTQEHGKSSCAAPLQIVRWLWIMSLSVPLAIGAFVIVECLMMGIPFAWTSWSRLSVWLGCVGAYFSAFLFLGLWFSRRTPQTKTAACIILSLFVALFVLQGSRELVMRLDGSALPPVPELPNEVRLSLFRPSGEPQVIPEREAMIADYLASVDAYSESLHALVSRRYRLERWWHVASPQLLLSEISHQLLQTQLPNIVDVSYSESPGNHEPSLMASLMSVGPELTWLLLLCAGAGFAMRFSPARRRELS